MLLSVVCTSLCLYYNCWLRIYQAKCPKVWRSFVSISLLNMEHISMWTTLSWYHDQDRPIGQHHYKSVHQRYRHTRISPLHVKDSTPYSQRITVRRICSDFDDFLNHAHKIADILKTGYPYELLTKALDKVKLMNRERLLPLNILNNQQWKCYIPGQHLPLLRI